MASTDIDSSAKHTVETTVAAIEPRVMDSFFITDSPQVTGDVGTGAMPSVMDTSAVALFLSRPVKIQTLSIPIGSSPFLLFDPWVSFLTEATIKPRISHFARLRANMVLRCNINGTPMHYGCFRVCYRPHPGCTYTQDAVYNHAVATESAGALTNVKIVCSQMEGFYVNPCRDSTLELRLPYLSQKPGFELYGQADFYKMGTVHVIGYAPLAHASGGTAPITLEFYAHLENVVLDVPTVVTQGYTMQEAAAIIKRALRATAKATAIANEWSPRILTAAAMLGFSRPLVDDAPSNVREIPFNLSNYDANDTSTPLSLSFSAEHTLGGQEVGVGGTDELVLSQVAGRRSFIGRATWTGEDSTGVFLLGSIVTPVQTHVSTYVKAPTPGVTAYRPVNHTCLTPAAFAAVTCRYWRGVVSYRFTVTGSPYHKGRLRIYYDPFPGAWAVSTNPGINVSNSVILDLAETDSVEVDVPWQNVRDMAECQSPFVQATHHDLLDWNLACMAASTDKCNGIIVCQVLSPLTSILPATSVVVMVEVCVKDLVLYSPRLPRSALGAPLSMDGEAIPYVPQSFDITGGDAIASLRQLVKRYVVEHEVHVSNTLNDGLTSFSSYETCVRFPVPGPVGSWGEAVDATPWNNPVNYTGLAFHTYVATAFALVRGGIRWKVNCSSRNNFGMGTASHLVERHTGALGDLATRRKFVAGSPATTALTLPDFSRRARNGVRLRHGDQGMQMTGENSNPGISGYLDVQFPFCANVRGYNMRATRFDVNSPVRHDNAVLVSETATAGSTTNVASFVFYEIATAAAEDFNVFGFVHAPAFLDAIPEPV